MSTPDPLAETRIVKGHALKRAWATVPQAALGNLAAKLLIVLAGLCITVLVARQGPRVQGAFALFVAVESLLLTLFSGLGLWLARQISQQQGLPASRQHLAWPMLLSVLRAALGLGLLAAVVLLALSFSLNRMPYSQLWLLALAAPFLLLVPTATGLWLGQGRMWPLNLAQVAAPVSVLLGLLLADHFTQGDFRAAPTVLVVLMAWVSGKSLVAVLTAIAALRDAGASSVQLRRAALDSSYQDASARSTREGAGVEMASAFDAASPRRLPRLRWWQEWRFIAAIGVANVLSLLNYRASLFLVERFKGLEAAGTYSVAVTVAELLWLLSSAVTVSLYARIGHPDLAVASRMTVRAVRINVVVTLLAAPVLMLAANWAVPWALGAAYEASLLPLAALLPGVAAYAAASSLSAFYTNHLGRPKLAGGIAALSLAISVALGLYTVPRWGAWGAGVSTSVGYGVAIVLAYAVFLRQAGLPVRALWRPHLTRD